MLFNERSEMKFASKITYAFILSTIFYCFLKLVNSGLLRLLECLNPFMARYVEKQYLDLFCPPPQCFYAPSNNLYVVI